MQTPALQLNTCTAFVQNDNNNSNNNNNNNSNNLYDIRGSFIYK